MQLNSFENIIGYKFNDPALLQQALTHSSRANEISGNPENGNERLEFLGDAVLEEVMSVYLFSSLPDEPEGKLTKLRASIVCEKSLAPVGKAIGIPQYLQLGKGEELSGGRDRASIIADCVEAVIGAVYLDGGQDAARDLILRLLKECADNAMKGKLVKDSKSELQERLQKQGFTDITYKIIDEVGPDHAKVFTAAVYVKDRQLGVGTGPNKKEAQMAAAAAALNSI